ncbi:GmrSD restriction endonuclease domain-containing protein [Flavobacterium panacis]|uniref:GmrSD restriction endonuclease domain-containing protein n=1 Tax=Flavobacterium panacis TaxID=2962567 RepID=UPI00214D59CE|nr:DUF262 domain-containing protein [Flavobacterium panacis]MCR4029486.1 DUF262 domain-containing protein [Flavobacterium panacis]
MAATTYFTPIALNREIPFTINNSENGFLYLFSKINDQEYKYKLAVSNDNEVKLLDYTVFVENEFLIQDKLISLYSEFLEESAAGYENTENIVSNNMPGYGPDEIFVENKPFSLRQIIDLIKSEDIEMSPDFQRNFVWDKTRQSRLIESILLGLPLPSIYLSQYKDGRLTVVDGLQRLTTIDRFMAGQFKLSNLEYLVDCNGLNYDELQGVLSPLRVRKFGQTQIMCFVIDYRSPSKLKFDLFRRLNTGGKPLNNQEIRNCLSSPELQKAVKKIIDLKSFKEATNNSIKDTRMDGRDAALRFIRFYTWSLENNFSKYNGDMESTLDDFIDYLNAQSPEKLEEYIEIYDNALKLSYKLFGSYSFRKMTPYLYSQGKKPPVNKLLMLVITVLLAKYDSIVDFRKNVSDLHIELMNLIDSDPDLLQALSWGTNGTWNIDVTFNRLDIFFKNLL